MDLAVVDAAVRYLTRQQRKNGAFPRIGRVHNYQLLVSDSYSLHIAVYITIQLYSRVESGSHLLTHLTH